MGYEKSSGINVYNQYGARETGGAVGVEHGKGSTKFLRIDLTGQSIKDAVAGFTPPVKLPKGARFVSFTLRVDEAFGLSGTSPTLQIGSADSVDTNGIEITETELENVGTKAIASTGAGTWATNSTTGLAAAAFIAFELGGTSPVVDGTKGKATLILEYVDVAKA